MIYNWGEITIVYKQTSESCPIRFVQSCPIRFVHRAFYTGNFRTTGFFI